jgi:ParB family transcriptional regulator, chromosome partitioning protein
MEQQLEEWKVSDLIEYARNPRKNDHAVDKVAAAIREFGFRVPILAKSDKTVVDGHLRLKAAKKLGLETVPVMLCDDMTDAQIKAFRISVNRVAEFAEWDDELLRIEFAELADMGFDLELTGFGLDEIEAMQFDDDAESEMPALADGEKEPFQQKTFTLHDEQAAIVDDAITLARSNPLVDTGLNENSNGNALALICQQWLRSCNG